MDKDRIMATEYSSEKPDRVPEEAAALSGAEYSSEKPDRVPEEAALSGADYSSEKPDRVPEEAAALSEADYSSEKPDRVSEEVAASPGDDYSSENTDRVPEEEAAALSQADFSSEKTEPDGELPDMTPEPPDHEMVEAVMARIVEETVGDIPEPAPQPAPEKKRMPAWRKALLILAGALGLACVVVYFYYALSYRGKYLVGTYINGIDASDMTPAEIEEVIRNRVEDYSLHLTFRDGEEEVLTNGDVGFHFVSDGGAEQILKDQNIFAWFMGYFDRYWPHTIGEAYDFDRGMMEEALLALPELSEDYQQAPTDACLVREGDFIAIQPETQGNTLIFDQLSEVVAGAVSEARGSVDLRDIDGMYEKPEVLRDDPNLTLQMADLNAFASGVTTYRLPKGETQVLDRSTLINWLSVTEGGYYYINVHDLHDYCEKYVGELADRIDQVNHDRVFHSTNFGDIYFDTDEWGYVIDREAEVEQLYNDLCNKVSSDREPAYSLFKEYDDTYGGKYVEVDITNQRMYLYENGERILSSDCVTGTDNASRRTVTGVYSIYYKQRNRTLLGQPDANGNPSYSSFVYYWMAFYGGYGLHDATWRSNFGGSIYKYSGSHGCVNLPYSVAKELYSLVEVGTPVIVFKM